MAQIFNNKYFQATDGEKFLSNFLAQNLNNEYEIYNQPHFLGNRPDIVVISRKGIFIIEIKDWKMERFLKKNNRFYRDFFDKGICEIINPFDQIKRYGDILRNIGDCFINLILYFHFANTKYAREFVGAKNVFGYDKLDEMLAILQNENTIKIESIKTLREFIHPPFHKKESGRDIKLSPQQKNLITHAPNSWKRIRGVAGSGKTLVVAQKAANIASHGKNALIVVYNKTLKNYIYEQINNAKYDFDRSLIDCFHFYEFGKQFIEENDAPRIGFCESMQEYTEQLLKRVYESLAKNRRARCYDCIIIDEAQDWNKEWFDCILRFLKENGEVLLVADDKQNIYERNISWIKGGGYKFRGVWGELKYNFRQRYKEIIKEANRFANMFLDDYILRRPDLDLEGNLIAEIIIEQHLIKPILQWQNLKNNDDIRQKTYEAYIYLKSQKREYEIVIICPNKKEGETIKQYFKDKGIDSIDNFKNKELFFMSDNRLKFSTIHSFKGLESEAVIYITPTNAKAHYETYIAITRAKDALIVLNRIFALNNYPQNSHWELA